MKKYLLPQSGNQYKANMHSHTMWSDGNLTPEELRDEYKKRGYSVVAYTDHSLFVDRKELAQEDFLPLNGYEIDLTEYGKPFPQTHTCHLNLIALDPDKKVPVCLHRSRYTFGHVDEHKADMDFGDEEDFEREYTPECINEVIKRGRENGFFVTYNHPTWSLEDYPRYIEYKDMNAVEIMNYSCIVGGYDDINTHCYDDLLRAGNRIAAVAGDDNHNAKPFGHPECDSCGAYTMIVADKLEYRTVTDALVNGNCYASMGPSINELYVEDGVITVRTSPAKRIFFTTDIRANKSFGAEEGKTINEASFKYNPDSAYVRITVIGTDGKPAFTRAYFADELN